MKRREFVKICASTVAGVSTSPDLLAEGNREMRSYNRVALVDPDSKSPITLSSLQVGVTYLFHYPFITTPCFLINLGQSIPGGKTMKDRNGGTYRWPGGVGPEQSFVAFSAICAHRMSHPAPSVSFINYRHGEAKFRNHREQVVSDRGVIYCCSEKSVYDPAEGGRVLGGPAPQPLATIILDYDDAKDALYATGTLGGEMFNQYFSSFGQRLVLDHGLADIRKAATENADLLVLEEYCQNIIQCSV